MKKRRDSCISKLHYRIWKLFYANEKFGKRLGFECKKLMDGLYR